MSRAVFLAIRSDGQIPLPYEYLRAMVCERMGWTLEYFDGLDTRAVFELLAVWDGVAKATRRT